MGTLFRFRRKHVPEVVEELLEPCASFVDLHNDENNSGGVREVGGIHLMEIHFNTLLGASGVVVLLLLAILVCYLCNKGILQKCCYHVAVACCGGVSPGSQGGGAGGGAAVQGQVTAPAVASPQVPQMPVVPSAPMLRNNETALDVHLGGWDRVGRQ